MVVPLLALEMVVNAANGRRGEELFLGIDGRGFVVREGIRAGAGCTCGCCSAFDGFCRFAGRSGEDDAALACGCAGSFGRGG